MPGIARRLTRYRLQVVGPCLALALSLPAGAQPRHLLGFVASLCNDEAHCFELLVEPQYQDGPGERIRVRFGSKTQIFDPENYELTLDQQNIVPGSHLRLLIERDSTTESNDYRASYIWIGD